MSGDLFAQKSEVTLLNHMGTDLTVVNAARVSFDKWIEGDGSSLSGGDIKLIKYLANHKHWSPFAHTSIQLRVTAPVFVARQLVKHQVGGVWNEVSRRYVDTPPSFYLPTTWRDRPDGSIKQGSGGEHAESSYFISEYKREVEQLSSLYSEMIAKGIAPEQARMILPQSMMTTWIWTGSLLFFHRVYTQRFDDHAQAETQEVAVYIGDICGKLFPVTWKALQEAASVG
jgi:thymidylate synthase (FAD)